MLNLCLEICSTDKGGKIYKAILYTFSQNEQNQMITLHNFLFTSLKMELK